MNELRELVGDIRCGFADADNAAAIGYMAYDAIYWHLERIDAAAYDVCQALKDQLLEDK